MPALIIQAINTRRGVEVEALHLIPQGESFATKLQPSGKTLRFVADEHGFSITEPTQSRYSAVLDGGRLVHLSAKDMRRTLWVIPAEDDTFEPKVVQRMVDLAKEELLTPDQPVNELRTRMRELAAEANEAMRLERR